jgi:hypothetical protein
MPLAVLYRRFPPRPSPEECNSVEKQLERCRVYSDSLPRRLDQHSKVVCKTGPFLRAIRLWTARRKWVVLKTPVRRGAEMPGEQIGLTPADTRGEGFPGATGVTKNAKTPGNPGFSTNRMLYEAAALTGLSYAAKFHNPFYQGNGRGMLASPPGAQRHRGEEMSLGPNRILPHRPSPASPPRQATTGRHEPRTCLASQRRGRKQQGKSGPDGRS